MIGRVCYLNFLSLLFSGNKKRFSKVSISRRISKSVSERNSDSRSNQEIAVQMKEQDEGRSSVEVSIVKSGERPFNFGASVLATVCLKKRVD